MLSLNHFLLYFTQLIKNRKLVMNNFTVDIVQEYVPVHLKNNVTQDLVDNLNNIDKDPDNALHIRDNFLSYSKVLQTGKYKLQDYLNAVKYISYKGMGCNNKEAYMRTFPDRYNSMVQAGKDDKSISSYVAAYNSNKLVNKVYEDSAIPIHVLHTDTREQALRTLLDLMLNSSSDKVKCDAANSVLTHTKKPETKELELNINTNDSSGMKELKELLCEVSKVQLAAIHSGVKTSDIAEQKLINVSQVR